MKKYLVISLLFCLIIVVSCSRRNEVDYVPKSIELKSSEDQFLRNFLVVDHEHLRISIGRNDALFAGATGTGYDDLMRQIGRINALPGEIDRNYWERQILQGQMQTKAAAVVEDYDKYHVLERDMFLEHFIYAENGEVLLKISEERAVLCGATAEGYRILCGEVEELNRMVQAGEADYAEVKECFDDKREYILRTSESSLLSISPEYPPPAYYGSISLTGGMRQDSRVIYGSDMINANIHVNYFSGLVTLEETMSGKRVTHVGYTTQATFKAMLTYPQGGYYSFIFTKGSDNYDASVHFNEYREGEILN